MDQKELSKELINTIKSPELEGLAIDITEMAIDQLFEAVDIAKDVPVVGSILKAIKLGISIKDIIFLRKLGNFLWHLKDVPQKYLKKLELSLMI